MARRSAPTLPRSTSGRRLPDPLYLLLLLPLAASVSFFLNDPVWAIAAAFLVPVAIGLARLAEQKAPETTARDMLTGLALRDTMEARFDDILSDPANAVRTSACLVVDLDDFHAVNERWGPEAADRILQATADRLSSVVREDDLVVRLEADAFAVALAPAERLTLDAVLAIGERILRTVAEPVAVDGASAYVSVCVGIALASKLHERNGGAMLAAAERAMVEARGHGAGALRVYSQQMHSQSRASHVLSEDVARALEEGQIKAWFQPQLSTDTGRVSGFEALARWTHHAKGPVPPAQFIPAIEAAGRTERLSEVMLYEALSALTAWERAGFIVPSVGVNFAGVELRNPRILEKVQWELDRFGVAPERLAIEILESVLSDSRDDIILRNIESLSQLGCRIDLDDFGTGHAAIASIKRFHVDRIKIDRSFIARVDQDGEQQRMVSAILTMAHQMGVESLAEGVETLGAHSILGQLGCDHVQGFGIARPMPLEETFCWLQEHAARIAPPPKINVKRQQG